MKKVRQLAKQVLGGRALQEGPPEQRPQCCVCCLCQWNSEETMWKVRSKLVEGISEKERGGGAGQVGCVTCIVCVLACGVYIETRRGQVTNRQGWFFE